MAKAVKDQPVARPYRSTLRADQAQETRRRVRDAADTLFLENGYTATSMDDIAKSAGVSRQTVFSAFGSKAALLKEVLDVRMAGDDEPVSIAERPDAQQMVASRDPVEAIRLQAKIVVDVALRISPVWEMVAGVFATEPELAELVELYDEGRLYGIGTVVDVVADLGALRKGRSRMKAKEAIWLATSPALVAAAVSRGWKRAELERWYVDCFTAILLEPNQPV